MRRSELIPEKLMYRLLRKLGFEQHTGREGFQVFTHPDDEKLWIILPDPKKTHGLAPHHVISVRFILDGFGVMDALDFDLWLKSAKTRMHNSTTRKSNPRKSAKAR